MLRRKTTTFKKEMSFVAGHLEAPIVLCITGGGWLVRSCLVASHKGCARSSRRRPSTCSTAACR